MFKRVTNFFRLDTALSLRDSLTVYSLISPVILAIILRLVVPSVGNAALTIAADRSVPVSVREHLEAYTRVEIYNNRGQILERVNRNDDVPGLYCENGEYNLVLEGNEDAESGTGFAAIVRDATADPDSAAFRTVTFQIEDLQGKKPPVLEYIAVMMVMLSLMIGGIITGFNIVNEKETKAINALAVSPLRMFEYIAARSILAIIIGCTAGIISVFILLGWNVNLAGLLIAMLLSLLVALPFGFVIGAFADNQMTAFALIKLLMAVFLTLPLVSLFVPAAWQWIFYLFPNYWMFSLLCHALAGNAHVGYGLSAILTAVTGLLLTGLLFPKLSRGLRLR